MLPEFAILATPRCRSAWMSVWLTDNEVQTFHEPARLMTRAPHIDSAFGGLSEKRRIGMVDTSMILWWQTLFDEMPDETPVAYVTRAPDTSALSLATTFGVNYDEALRLTETMHYEFCKAWNARPGFRTTFAELSKPEVLQGLWGHVRPNDPFPAERTALLTAMNIQHEPEDMRAPEGSSFYIEIGARLKELGVVT